VLVMGPCEPDQDDGMGIRDGAPIRLIQTPTVTDHQIRAMRAAAMTVMRQQGWSNEVIAKVFGASVRTVIRSTKRRVHYAS
jgi:carbamoylphosphate synthase large subunit